MASSSSFEAPPAHSAGVPATSRRPAGWVDRAAADDREDLVPDPLQPQTALDGRPVELGELDGARQAEEVRRMEEVHVQGVALDPLPAVQEAAQRADRGSTSTPNRRSKAWTAVSW